jgi:hypothetical protein
MRIRFLFAAVAWLFVMAFTSQSTYAGEVIGGGFIGSFPVYHGDYPYYDGDYPPAPLIVPYGYYRCVGGCCRRPAWSGQHWHNVTTCNRPVSRRVGVAR